MPPRITAAAGRRHRDLQQRAKGKPFHRALLVYLTVHVPQNCLSQPDRRHLQATIEEGLQLARCTRAANLADGHHGRLLGGDIETGNFWFIDCEFIEGVHYALDHTERAAQRVGARLQRLPGATALINLGAPVR